MKIIKISGATCSGDRIDGIEGSPIPGTTLGELLQLGGALGAQLVATGLDDMGLLLRVAELALPEGLDLGDLGLGELLGQLLIKRGLPLGEFLLGLGNVLCQLFLSLAK